MNMNMNQILGVAALALGAVLLGFAYHSSNAPIDQLSNTLTGRYTDQTMWYLGLGVVAAVGGGLLAVFGKRTT
jgi:drug/metabolite transporter (DMT)-like permease